MGDNMKNSFVLFLLLMFSTESQAAIKRQYKKVGPTKAQVQIQTDEGNSTQATTYLDAFENKQFIHDLLNDKKSSLYKIANIIQQSNCGKFQEGCGQITVTDEVKTSYWREGWMSGGTTYTFFVGFTNEGSGHYFDVSYMVTISESVNAQVKNDGSYAGTVIKNYSLVNIIKLESGNP